MTAAPICPRCLNPARATQTRYGVRHQCCGLHSWDGKPLVSQDVHDARQRCHAAFDPVWKNGERAYTIKEEPLSPEYDKAVKRIRRSMRNRAYLYIAHATGLPEPDCHMSEQTDLRKLALIERTARDMTPESVRAWWKKQARERAT